MFKNVELMIDGVVRMNRLAREIHVARPRARVAGVSRDWPEIFAKRSHQERQTHHVAWFLLCPEIEVQEGNRRPSKASTTKPEAPHGARPKEAINVMDCRRRRTPLRPKRVFILKAHTTSAIHKNHDPKCPTAAQSRPSASWTGAGRKAPAPLARAVPRYTHALAPASLSARRESFLDLGTTIPQERHTLIRLFKTRPCSDTPSTLLPAACLRPHKAENRTPAMETGLEDAAYLNWPNKELVHHKFTRFMGFAKFGELTGSGFFWALR
ncbi:hypothetical protein K438DRAFT_1757448 [Mycena galopus ATCC 62051]|nr:hypothetical protein K438DRAFT_1757448 [Mycena galopus ATCC 62051]